MPQFWTQMPLPVGTPNLGFWRKAAVPIPPPPAPQEVVGCDQPLQRLPSVAAAGGDGLAGGRVQVDGRWRRGLGRSGRTGWANGW